MRDEYPWKKFLEGTAVVGTLFQLPANAANRDLFISA